ncbi:MAG: polysaccharide biosynthesis protein [Clostridiales bacterium]|nr:polysaccharide biosynthesis protein [Clostridiales bacterium]
MQNILLKKRFKIIVLFIADILSAALAVYLSTVVRFVIDYSFMPEGSAEKMTEILKYWLPSDLLIFVFFKMYNRIWEYASIIEALRSMAAAFCSFLALIAVGKATGVNLPGSCYLLAWIFLTAFTLSTRFSHRIICALRQAGLYSIPSAKIKNIMIIGAGHAGNALIRDIEKDKSFSNFRVVCLIDDDPNKINRYIGYAKVVGGRDKIIWAAKKYHVDEIIFAIPSADNHTRHEFFSLCLETPCVIKTLPSYYQMISGKIKISMLRKIEIEDLLERPQIEMEGDGLSDFIQGKTVLVTGAGGSIGSELCRQLAKYEPEKLIALDIYENNMYFLQNEMKETFPNLEMVCLIASVRDRKRIEGIFAEYRPDIVYHAAAHKHVPLMEDSPGEAVKNNVIGTLNSVIASDMNGVSRFVLISTDKAVNPTNVMGATKRICEMIIQYYAKYSKTEFVSVRFVNLLGSSGSVIPIFRKQIENGGPVTVTHPEIIRYFMTIPEAVSLVLQAGTYARGGEIFILDMGEPVKVLNLAENMIRLSGHVPYRDIDIAFTGLRPGEKIYEELLMSEEGIAATKNKKIFIGKPIDMDEEKFLKQLDRLKSAAEDNNCDIRSLIQEIVPTYNYNNSNNSSQNQNTQQEMM